MSLRNISKLDCLWVNHIGERFRASPQVRRDGYMILCQAFVRNFKISSRGDEHVAAALVLSCFRGKLYYSVRMQFAVKNGILELAPSVCSCKHSSKL